MNKDERSVTPSRRYGDIIGSIFSNGSAELEERKRSSVSHAKRMFRERSQWSSLRRSQSRNPTPEQRQSVSSPIRQYNENRSMSRPLTPDRSNSRPPTPDRKKSIIDSNSKGSTSDKISISQSEPLTSNFEATSKLPRRSSPIKNRDQRINSVGSSDTLTVRVAKQVSKDMKKITESGQIFSESEQSKEETGNMGNVLVLQTKKETKQDTKNTKNIDLETESISITPTLERLSVSDSLGNIEQMEDLIQVQNEQIKFLEESMKRRSNDIERLTLELKLTKKNESKLILELEIHDLKYSMFDDYRRMMDKLRLENTYNKEEDSEIGRDLGVSPSSNIDNAFSKLEYLGELYEKSKLEAESRFSILQEEYKSARLTRSLAHRGLSTDVSNTKSLRKVATIQNIPGASVLLENRIKFLESENLKYSNELKRTEEEVEKAKLLQPRFFSRIEENILKAHNIEKKKLENKIVALETEIGFASGNIDIKTRTRRYRALEKNLNDYVAEIMGLEDQLKIKDKIISKLKERDLMLNAGLKTQEVRDRHLLVSSTTQNKQSEEKQRMKNAPTKPFSGQRTHVPNKVLEQIDKFVEPNKSGTKGVERSRTVKYNINKMIKGNKIESRTTIDRKESSVSSTRIAMLRKRLDALANDYSSVGTDDTQISIKTLP